MVVEVLPLTETENVQLSNVQLLNKPKLEEKEGGTDELGVLGVLDPFFPLIIP